MINHFLHLRDIVFDILDYLFGLFRVGGSKEIAGSPYGDCEAQLYHDYQDGF